MSGQRSSRRSANSGARIGTSPLTYGVELELVFAFHESKLRHLRYLSIVDQTYKNLSYEQRRVRSFSRVNDDILPNRTYNSWGVFSELQHPALRLQPYSTQPLFTAQRALRTGCPELPTNVRTTLQPEDKEHSLYKRWLITVDHSVC